MGFTQKLEDAARAAEAELERLLGALAPASETSPRLLEAMRHAVLGGGKRFRPFLVMESAALFGVPRGRALMVAAALECVHCYSLAHDDLPAMDNDTLRRGRPTVWRAFDEWTAILAGDALLTLAFEILSDPATHPDAATRSMLVARLARASGARGMVGGQALDLEAEKLASREPMTIETVRRLQGMKTGALIRFACEAGPVLAAAGENEVARMSRFGDLMGFAFQIADDLLDVEGSAEEVGKAVAKDAAAGKATLVSLMGVEPARRKLRALEAEARDLLAAYGADARALEEATAFVVNRRS